MTTGAPKLASVWLMPSEADAHMLAAIVGDLSARFGTPVFAPHLTIAGDVPVAPHILGAALAAMAKATGPIAAPIVDVVIGSSYFRSLFASFDRSDGFDALKRAAIHAGLGGSLDGFLPHVSLLYGHPPDTDKFASAARLRPDVVGRVIAFDRLAATSSSDVAPIEDWRIVEVATLG